LFVTNTVRRVREATEEGGNRMTDITAGPAPVGIAARTAPAAVAAFARHPGRWAVFAAVLLVDSSVTHVGGPAIRESLGGGESLFQWLGAG
jgi:hypothetical protein